MNLLALVIGICISIIIIVHFKKTRLEKSKSAYAVLLFTFPIYYFFFAIFGNDFAVIPLELAIGFLFFAIAFFALKLNGLFKFGLLAVGYILHGVYDVIHNQLFVNAGTPVWWPEFCGVIDIVIGLYLISLAFKHRASDNNRVAS